MSDYPVLLVVITVVDNNKAQVKALTQVKQMVCLCFGPAIIVQMHLILLLRVHWHLHCLERQNRKITVNLKECLKI